MPVRFVGASADRVSVIYEGPGWVCDETNDDISSALRSRYGLPDRYIAAFTGGDNPHKNVARLLAAFEAISADIQQTFVLIGNIPPFLADRLRNLPRVQTLGYVPSTDIRGILGCSDLFVLGSVYEGFGLPVVEAQRSGAPVVCSGIGALREIASDAAVYFDPYSVTEIASAIRSVLMDVDCRADLSTRGKTNSYRFSWRRTAEQTLQVYEEAANRSVRQSGPEITNSTSRS
jgi:glycosyltransferase involved in cell wall biosynthesis